MRGKGKEGDLIDLDQEESWGEVFLRESNRLSRNGIYNILSRDKTYWKIMKEIAIDVLVQFLKWTKYIC